MCRVSTRHRHRARSRRHTASPARDRRASDRCTVRASDHRVMDPSTGLPYGWESRTNAMSEKDIKLGGVAAGKFSSKGELERAATSAYGEDASYKTSDEVAAFWLAKIDAERAEAAAGEGDGGGALPSGWEERQRAREAERRQYGAFAAPSTSASGMRGGVGAEAALVECATFTLENLASVLETRLVSLPVERRAAFSAALKRANDAVMKCR
jgi:hypothetical protein